MSRITLMITLLLAGTAAAGTFNPAPFLADADIDVLTRQVTNQSLDRDLFKSPYATVVVGNVDVYEGFPFLEARYFQIVSDPGWNRLVYGEVDRGLQAFDGQGTSFGPLNKPRGMAVDDQGRIYVADTDNNRVVVFETVTEFDRMTLVPLYQIRDLNQPHDVAFSDGGTPFEAGDDALYVANTGKNEVRRYGLEGAEPQLTSTVGGLGSAAGDFAGPVAVTVGRLDGAHTNQITVADAHNERLVQLNDQAGNLTWVSEQKHEMDVVTSLTTDHFGNIYAAGPEGGVSKYTPGLKAVAGSMAATHRPRGFHVPTVTVTDHRTGQKERTGEGRGILVEEWDQGSGLRVMGLGVEVKNPALAADGSAAVDMFLTDQANVTVELRDPLSGDLVALHRAGARATGAQRVAFQAEDGAAGWEAGEYSLTVTARSTYDDEVTDEVTMTVKLAQSGDPNLPRALKVVGNVPNPFNPSTTIEFLVPAGNHDNYSLNVYDAQGRLVRRLASGTPTPGLQRVVWDGKSEAGSPAPSGLYLYRVVVGQEKATGKMVLLK